jgi:histidinol phosphatase-like PHP family hydrolase
MNNDYHIHTDFTDGKMSVEQIAQLHKEFPNITMAITEHIRKEPSYDWFTLRDTVKHFDKSILVGVEAKVLDEDGNLDCPDKIINQADIVLGSVHGQGKVEWLLESSCDIIAHPDITENNIHHFKACQKVLEINSKHRLPLQILDQLVEDNLFSFGSDAHTINGFYEAQTFFDEILQRYPKIRLNMRG